MKTLQQNHMKVNFNDQESLTNRRFLQTCCKHEE